MADNILMLVVIDVAGVNVFRSVLTYYFRVL